MITVKSGEILKYKKIFYLDGRKCVKPTSINRMRNKDRAVS